MGYDDFSSLGRKDWTGGSTVVPWWTEIMGEILKEYPKRDFPVPANIVFQKIDSSTVQRSLPTCPKNKLILKSFLAGSEPTDYCSVDHTLPVESQLGTAPSDDILGSKSGDAGKRFRCHPSAPTLPRTPT